MNAKIFFLHKLMRPNEGQTYDSLENFNAWLTAVIKEAAPSADIHETIRGLFNVLRN